MIKEGILNINKPQDMTSHDVVAIVRRCIGMKKVGHTGTLDPMATGVLPVCIGKSTRIIEYLDMDIKKYRCKMILGLETDTQDIWGEVLKRESTDGITESDVRKAFEPFNGVIDQKPPMYSALKVNGKKLYEYAREGIEVEVKTRKIFIKSLDIEEMNLEGEEKTVTFTVECSKGTYIRTICQDAGKALGTCATMCELTRLSSGRFDISESVTIDELREMSKEEIESKLFPTDYPLNMFGKVTTDEVNSVKFINGWHLDLNDCEREAEPFYADKDFYLPIREEFRKAYNVYGTVFGESGFLGVAFYSDKYRKLVADKVFYSR